MTGPNAEGPAQESTREELRFRRLIQRVGAFIAGDRLLHEPCGQCSPSQLWTCPALTAELQTLREAARDAYTAVYGQCFLCPICGNRSPSVADRVYGHCPWCGRQTAIGEPVEWLVVCAAPGTPAENTGAWQPHLGHWIRRQPIHGEVLARWSSEPWEAALVPGRYATRDDGAIAQVYLLRRAAD